MDLFTLILACAPMVAPDTLKAIVLEESRGHPYAIHDGKTGRALFPATEAEAVATAQALITGGSRIDAGLAQINSDNWNWLGLTAETVFDPCANLRAGERVILGAYLTPPHTLDAALSRYNTGDAASGFRNGYVRRVKARMDSPHRGDLEASATKPPPTGDPPDASLALGSEPGAAPMRVRPWSFIPVADGFDREG